MEKIIFEKGKPGRKGNYIPPLDVPESTDDEFLPSQFRRKTPPHLPELTEVETVRHFTRLSQLNYGVDTGFYPLGSCTMKYNPKINEDAANLTGFKMIHPYQPEESLQGALELMAKTQSVATTREIIPLEILNSLSVIIEPPILPITRPITKS
jgi:glycine dehydrogenase subunit 2